MNGPTCPPFTAARSRRLARTSLAVLLGVALIGCSSDSNDDDGDDTTDDVRRYRLTTEFLGEDRALVARQGTDDTTTFAFEAASDDDADQAWSIGALDEGRYRIVNRGAGDALALDVVNDGVFDRVALAPAGDMSGQRWSVTPLDNGFCRLSNDFTGSEIALDVTLEDEQPTLRAVDDVSGQHWQLTQLGMSADAGPLDGLCSGAVTP